MRDQNFFFTVPLFFLLSGCLLPISRDTEVKFSPDVLPEAQVGQRYEVEIDVLTLLIIPETFKSRIVPANGLKLEARRYLNDGHFPIYNKLRLVGVPEHTGEVQLFFSGMTNRTMTENNMKFEKEYSLIVRE